MVGPQPNYFITAQNAIAWNPVGYWLMACYAYEELDANLMQDAEFDKLAVWLTDNWLDVMDKADAHLLDPTFLKSSLGSKKPRCEWPTRCMVAAHQLMDTIHGKGEWGDVGASYKEMLAKRFPPAPPKPAAEDYGDLC